MPTKRMFSNNIIGKDVFVELSPLAQLLYFHLGMKTDDDGFVSQTKTIANLIGAADKEINELIDAGFIIPFLQSKVYAITHFRINNDLKNDRYHPTDYQREWNMLEITENKEYRLKTHDSPLFPNSIHDVSNLETEPNGAQRNPNNVALQSGGKGSDEGEPENQSSIDAEALIAQGILWGINRETMIEFINKHGASDTYRALRHWHDSQSKDVPFDIENQQ